MTVATQDAMTADSPAKYDIFLGGSCNPTTWRQETAIPFLEQRDIHFYNPQMPFWRPEFIQLEHEAKMNASLLFFVVDNETRAVASMIETTYLAACGRCLVLVVNLFRTDGHVIAGESISRKELHDLSYAQHVMMDLVEREGIPVFDNMDRALDCSAYIIGKQRLESSSYSGAGFCVKAGSNFGVSNPIRMSHVTLGDKLKKVKEAFNALDIYNVGKLSIEDIGMAFRILTKRNLTPEEIRNIQARGKKRRLSASFSSHYSNVPSYVRDRRSGSSGCIMRKSVASSKNPKEDSIPSPLSTTTVNNTNSHHDSSLSTNSSIAKSHSTSDATIWTNNANKRPSSGRPILPHVRAETVDLCRNSRGGLMTSSSAANCVRKGVNNNVPVGKSSSSINLALKKKARRRTVSGLTKEANDEDGVVDEGLPDYGRIVETTRNSIDEGAGIDFDEFCRIVAALKVREDRRKRSPPVSLITLDENGDGSSLTLSDVSSSSDKANGQAMAFEPAMWREENYWNWWKCGGRQDVYLGGVPGDTNWRENIAIPMLKKNALTYYCPSSCAWSDRLSSTDMAAMDTSRVLLFVITDRTRSLGSMIMAAYYIGLGRDVILCIQLLPRSMAVQGEVLSEAAVKDYNRGRVYLNDLARREGVPVFEGVKEAVECAVQKCLQG